MPNLVTEATLLANMREGITYRKHEVAELFPQEPASVVFDVLEALVAGGQVWRTYDSARWSYLRLSKEDQEQMQKRQADRSDTPAWMLKTLTGYTSQLFQHWRNPEPTSYRSRIA